MKAVLHLLKEQYDNKHLILRLAAFEQRSKFLLHYLGALWQVFSPLMQVVVFFCYFWSRYTSRTRRWRNAILCLANMRARSMVFYIADSAARFRQYIQENKNGLKNEISGKCTSVNCNCGKFD